jgi:hypothetical protein
MKKNKKKSLSDFATKKKKKMLSLRTGRVDDVEVLWRLMLDDLWVISRKDVERLLKGPHCVVEDTNLGKAGEAVGFAAIIDDQVCYFIRPMHRKRGLLWKQWEGQPVRLYFPQHPSKHHVLYTQQVSSHL